MRSAPPAGATTGTWLQGKTVYFNGLTDAGDYVGCGGGSGSLGRRGRRRPPASGRRADAGAVTGTCISGIAPDLAYRMIGRTRHPEHRVLGYLPRRHAGRFRLVHRHVRPHRPERHQPQRRRHRLVSDEKRRSRGFIRSSRGAVLIDDSKRYANGVLTGWCRTMSGRTASTAVARWSGPSR